jgi:hypothetical protein
LSGTVSDVEGVGSCVLLGRGCLGRVAFASNCSPRSGGKLVGAEIPPVLSDGLIVAPGLTVADSGKMPPYGFVPSGSCIVQPSRDTAGVAEVCCDSRWSRWTCWNSFIRSLTVEP